MATIVQLYLAPAALAAVAIGLAYLMVGLNVIHDREILKLATVPVCLSPVYTSLLKLLRLHWPVR